MKSTQSLGTRPVHQTVAPGFNFKSGDKAIAVEFTNQRLSPHAGSAAFWGWLHPLGWTKTLATALPHTLLSNNRLAPLAKTKVTIHSLRFWLFVTAGSLSHPKGKTTIKLAVPLRERDWWRRLWGKILSPFPNCNAVENRPAFTT